MSSDRLQQVESVCLGYVDRGEVIGTGTAVEKRGGIVYIKSHGLRDSYTDIAMTDDTIFRIFSMIKPLASVAVRASGEPFEAFVQRRITEPLGMVDTSFTVHQSERARLATLYSLQDDGTLAPGEDPPVMGFTRPTSQPTRPTARLVSTGGAGLPRLGSGWIRRMTSS